jgi:hypothetical protein
MAMWLSGGAFSSAGGCWFRSLSLVRCQFRPSRTRDGFSAAKPMSIWCVRKLRRAAAPPAQFWEDSFLGRRMVG